MNEIDWKERLRLKLEEFVDGFVVDGAKHEELFDAIIAEIGRLRIAYERDPDPADDVPRVIEEPANDWPFADRPRE